MKVVFINLVFLVISLILNQGKMHSFIHYVHISSVLHLDIEHTVLIN